MALIKIPKEMGSTPGIVDNSNDTAITIDSSENVGIGITPSVKLEVDGGSDGSVVFSGRSDGGNGNNQRFNLIAFSDGGGSGYGGGLKIQTRSSTNVFSDVVTLSSAGNLLVNTSSFGSLGTLVIKQLSDTKGLALIDDSSTNTFFIQNLGSEARISHNDTSPMTFHTNSTERMRINSAGNVGIGTDSPTLAGTGYRGLSISGPTGQGASITLKNSAGHTAYLYSERTGDDFLIEAAGDVVLRAGGSESMRIDSSGRVAIATTPQSGIQLKVVGSGQEHTIYCIGDNAGYAPLLVDNSASSGTRFFTSFRINNSTKGNITSTGSVMVYGGTSDYRLKENVISLTGATDRLKQLKPKRFNFIGDAETMDGFLAHEVAAVVPVAVVGEKDAVDENGEVNAQQMDNGLLVPLLVATIQELEARLTALENN